MIYENGTSAWYQGDIVGGSHTYKNVVWKSEIATGKLQQTYLPIGHYPEVGTPQSIIQRAEPYERGIILRQLLTYSSNGKQVKEHFTYLIDTKTTAGSFTLIEAQGLKHYKTIIDIYNWMKRSLGGRIQTPAQYGLKLDSVTGSGLNIVKVSTPQPGTVISLDNFRTIFPEKNWFGDLTGEISPVLPTELKDNKGKAIDINQTDYQLNLISYIKGTNNIKDIYFWQILKKTSQYELVTLLIDDRNEGSKAVNLASFGIAGTQVTGITSATDGCIIFTSQATYHLSADEDLTLQALNHIWEACEGWVQAIKSTIARLSNRREEGSTLPATKEANKAIDVDPLIANPKQRLLAWYDSVNDLFFVTEEKDKQRFNCLGIANDGKGAWLVDYQTEKNALPVIDAKVLATALDKGTLVKGKESQIPTIKPIPAAVLTIPGDTLLGASYTII